MRPSDVAELLDSYIAASCRGDRVPAVCLRSPPGVCKTSLFRQAQERAGIMLLEHQLQFKEPVDISGCPEVVNGKTRWCPPVDLVPENLPDNGLLLLDELGQCEHPMQKAMGPVVLEKRFDKTRLPPNWFVGATTNRVTDRAGSFRFLVHLRNRLVMIDVEVSLDDFLEWGANTGKIHAYVLSFLAFKHELLLSLSDGDEQDATPRSWEILSSIVPCTPIDLRREVFSGTVGRGPATEIVTFIEIKDSLPDIERILEKPKTHDLPDKSKLSVVYATVVSLAERIKGAPAKIMEAAACYVSRMPKEFSTVFVQCAMTSLAGQSPEMKKDRKVFLAQPSVTKWILDNRFSLAAIKQYNQ